MKYTLNKYPFCLKSRNLHQLQSKRIWVTLLYNTNPTGCVLGCTDKRAFLIMCNLSTFLKVSCGVKVNTFKHSTSCLQNKRLNFRTYNLNTFAISPPQVSNTIHLTNHFTVPYLNVVWRSLTVKQHVKTSNLLQYWIKTESNHCSCMVFLSRIANCIKSLHVPYM